MYDIGPARFQAMQNQSRADRMRMLMNMFMMMKQMKQRQTGQEQTQQRWEAEAPMRQARTDYWQAQARPKAPSVPAPIQTFQWLVQNGWKPKDAERIAFKTKPEEIPAWLEKAQYLVHADPERFPNIPSAVMYVLGAEAKEKFSGWQQYQIGENEKKKAQEMINNAIGAIEKEIKTEEKGKIDLKTGNLAEADPNAMQNWRQAVDALRGIDAKIGAGKGTKQDVALAAKIYGSINKIKKEGAFWEKDEFGYTIGEIKTTKKGVWKYIGNNKWQMVQ